MRVLYSCPQCYRKTHAISEIPTVNPAIKIYKLSCGHFHTIKGVTPNSVEHWKGLKFEDGRQLFHYQALTCNFAERANLSCLIAHEMGLGKTIIYQGLLKNHWSTLTPGIILCKSGLMRQWFHESLSCLGPQLIQTINGGREFPLPMMKLFIISLDMLSSLDLEPWTKLNIKSICIDEVQLIKSHKSKRTQAVRKFVQELQPKVIGLSGTPIKNNPGEYFPILNLLRPELFPTEAGFIQNWCEYDSGYYGTKVKRLRSPRDFKEFTKSFIIRYEREEVMPDLPRIYRQNRFIDMTNDFDKAYQEVVSEFESFVRINEEKEDNETMTNLLAYLAKMRHLTGLAKIESAVDFTTEFLLETNRKLVIFVHHKDVHDIIKLRLDTFLKDAGLPECLSLTSELTADEKHEVVQDFWTDKYRILIASTLASGEGLNLQICSDAIMLERQWNPANEEQAEARFTRIGSKADQVNINYITAVGTVDEFLANIIERKRAVNKEVLSGVEQESWTQSQIIRELTDLILNQKLKSWSMPKGN